VERQGVAAGLRGVRMRLVQGGAKANFAAAGGAARRLGHGRRRPRRAVLVGQARSADFAKRWSQGAISGRDGRRLVLAKNPWFSVGLGGRPLMERLEGEPVFVGVRGVGL